jgi:hypothetical protein
VLLDEAQTYRAAGIHAKPGEMPVLKARSLGGTVPVARRVASRRDAADGGDEALHNVVLPLVCRAEEADRVLRLSHESRQIAARVRRAAALLHDRLEYGLQQRSRGCNGGGRCCCSTNVRAPSSNPCGTPRC